MNASHVSRSKPPRAVAPASASGAANHYVFIARDQDETRLSAPTGIDLARLCFQEGAWGLNDRTAHLKAFQPGDKVAFYAGGARSRGVFIAMGELALATRFRRSCRRFSLFFPHQVALRGVGIFPEPVSIRPLIGRLDLTKKGTRVKWGMLLCGACGA
jgi:hypothetical protein